MEMEKDLLLREGIKKDGYWLNILLFIITLFTTMFVGALQQGVIPTKDPILILKGLPFSMALIFILLSHELGHYFTSKSHGVKVTLPYFIPAPTIIGTFGAFIKMKSPLEDRNSLVDIGIAGPLVGFVVSLPILIIGLYLSELRYVKGPIEGGALGSPLLLHILINLIFGRLPENVHIMLHPVGFAGWIGLLVTSLNLLPVGQLDGGHISYALLQERHEKVSLLVIFILFLFGLLFWPGWFIWGALLIFLGVRHPRPIDSFTPLDGKRKILGLVSLAILLLTFTPTPFKGF